MINCNKYSINLLIVYRITNGLEVYYIVYRITNGLEVYYFHFLKIKSWSHDQSEFTNIFHSLLKVWDEHERERERETEIDRERSKEYGHSIDVSDNIYGCLSGCLSTDASPDAFLGTWIFEFFGYFQTVLRAFF